MTTLAATPFDYSFDLAHTALVLIDMQRDFVEAGGFGASLGNDVTRLQAIVPTLQRLLAAWRHAGALVIHTRECHRPDLADCPPAKRLRGKPSLRIGDAGPMGRLLIAGEPGADIIEALAPASGEWIIDKPGKGAFHATGLHERLQAQGITHLVFTGVTTEVCVQTSMREANDRGYECLIIEDATESYFAEYKAATLAMITAQGAIIGWSGTSSQLIEAVQGTHARAGADATQAPAAGPSRQAARAGTRS
jgi:nicotinamidase-related amidase